MQKRFAMDPLEAHAWRCVLSSDYRHQIEIGLF